MALAWAGIAWVAGAMVRYYTLRPLLEFVSWPWKFTPAWRVDLLEPSMGPQWEVLVQGGLLIWIAVAVALIGWAAMRRLDPDGPPLAQLAWGSGLVLGTLGMVVFFVGVCGGLSRPVFIGILAALTLGAIWGGMGILPMSGDRDTGGTPVPHKEHGRDAPATLARATPSAAEWVVLAVCAALQFVTLLYALTPSTQSDALRYHMSAPQEWLKAGRLVYLPYNAFSNFPSTVEMLFLFGLGLSGDLLAKGFHFLFFPLTTGAVALLTSEAVRCGAGVSGVVPQDSQDSEEQEERKEHGQDARATILGLRPSILAVAVWSTSPIVVPLAGWDYIDLAVLLFGLGIVYYLIRWARSGRAAHWLLAAAFGGLLCGSKYTGVLTVALGGAILLAFGIVLREGRGLGAAVWTGIRRAVVFGLVAAAIASPWWIKNAVHTGNPVYPMAWGLFGGGEWTEVNTEVYIGKTREKGEGRDLKALIRLPWATAMYPRTFEDFAIGPFYWLFTPWILVWGIAGLASPRRRRASAMTALWGVFFIVSIFYTYQSNRFFLPVWALGTVAACAAAAWAARLGVRTASAILIAFFLPVAYSAADSTRWLFFDTGQFFVRGGIPTSGTHWPAYTLGYMTRDQYLATQIAYYPAAKYANEHLGPGDKVLLVGEHRKMHWRTPVEGNDWYDLPRIQPFLRESGTADEVLDRLREAGFTHLFFNLDEWGWPRDPNQQTGEIPPAAGSAWSYNIRFLSRDDILKIRGVLASPRLRVEMSVTPGRVFLAAILPKSQNVDNESRVF
ncbi:glycosyltransferase family 39 protein [Candidatus Sumerlaeota bacterium]|nr:glycosyltransferase family 39 protein [Candidatus Sumerlaeota bacterium]